MGLPISVLGLIGSYRLGNGPLSFFPIIVPKMAQKPAKEADIVNGLNGYMQ